MDSNLVMTVIGADRPGLVEMVAARVADHGGNWLESRMCRLGGQFAGILRVAVAARARDGLVNALRTLEVDGLRIIIHAEPVVPAAGRGGALATLELVGNDRPGIVRDVTAAIAAHTLSIDTFRSRTLEAPMAGGTLFEATVTVSLPAAADAETLTAALEALAGEIQVDLTVA